jgi:putative ABC transport system permease protein
MNLFALKSIIKQTHALCGLSVKSLPLRFSHSVISIISIACVTAVMLTVLTLTDGMHKTMAKSALDNSLLVMRTGASAELQSVLFPIEVNMLSNHPSVVRDSHNQALYAAEMFVSSQYKHAENQQESSLTLRGVSKNSYLFRPNFSLVQGQKFQTGVREILVGQAIARKYPQFSVGNTIQLGTSQWLISGIFSDNNSVFEAELWADLAMVQADYQRGNSVQSLRLVVQQNTDLAQLQQQWQDDPRLNVSAQWEKTFFAQQGQKLTRLIRWLGFPIAIIMALGAAIAALNTMYAAIASRSKEIATYKAIGFSAEAMFLAVLFEAMLLALIGALLGILPLYLGFNGYTAATQNASNLSQLLFNFNIRFELISQALICSVAIGLIGGLLPALQALRLPVTHALRE